MTLVFDWCRRRVIPVAFALAGGYRGDRLSAAGLVALHRLTLTAATSAQGTATPTLTLRKGSA